MSKKWFVMHLNMFAPKGPTARIYVAGEMVGRAVRKAGKWLIKADGERIDGLNLLDLVHLSGYPYLETGFQM